MAEGASTEVPSPLPASAFLLRKHHSHPNLTVFLNFHSPTIAPSHTLTTPHFNSDSLHYTPSFGLPCDSWRYKAHQEVYRNLHLRKVGELQQQKSILMVPRPSKNNSYCCVCKIPFEDYLTHLNTPSHALLVRNSEYTQRIMDLCSVFTDKTATVEPTPRKRGRPAKPRPIGKVKPISKLPSLTSKRSLSGKETDQSCRPEDLAHQLAA